MDSDLLEKRNNELLELQIRVKFEFYSEEYFEKEMERIKIKYFNQQFELNLELELSKNS